MYDIFYVTEIENISILQPYFIYCEVVVRYHDNWRIFGKIKHSGLYSHMENISSTIHNLKVNVAFLQYSISFYDFTLKTSECGYSPS